MPYDPNFPPTDAELVSAEFREQFNALKALVDAQAAQIAALTARVEDTEAAVLGTALNPVGLEPNNFSFSEPVTASEGMALNLLINAVITGVKRP